MAPRPRETQPTPTPRNRAERRRTARQSSSVEPITMTLSDVLAAVPGLSERTLFRVLPRGDIAVLQDRPGPGRDPRRPRTLAGGAEGLGMTKRPEGRSPGPLTDHLKLQRPLVTHPPAIASDPALSPEAKVLYGIVWVRASQGDRRVPSGP